MSNNPGNETAASLALATNLQTQMAQPEQPKETPQEAPQTPETAPEHGETAKPEEDMTKQFDAFKEEIKHDIKGELSQVREMIKSALEDETN